MIIQSHCPEGRGSKYPTGVSPKSQKAEEKRQAVGENWRATCNFNLDFRRIVSGLVDFRLTDRSGCETYAHSDDVVGPAVEEREKCHEEKVGQVRQ